MTNLQSTAEGMPADIAAMLFVLLLMVGFVGWMLGRWRRDDIGDGHRLDAQNARLERDRALHSLEMERIDRRCERDIMIGAVNAGHAVKLNNDGTVSIATSGSVPVGTVVSSKIGSGNYA